MELFVVKVEHDRDLHASGDGFASLTSRFILPFQHGLLSCGFELALAGTNHFHIAHITIGIDDETKNDFAVEACSTHFKGIVRTGLDATYLRLLVEVFEIKDITNLGADSSCSWAACGNVH